MGDIVDLQNQVTQSMVAAIAPRLEQAKIDRVQRQPTERLDADHYYLRGMVAFHAFTRSANAAGPSSSPCVPSSRWVTTNGALLSDWQAAADGQPADWHKVFRGYRSGRVLA